jgi:hypothetical protein
VSNGGLLSNPESLGIELCKVQSSPDGSIDLTYLSR